ncbi:ComEC/Rec2 family competence protein [Dendrosporobacter sp. 1207_IL3150]|uniref:ComEC/Rec2 family competence protein n=1 Tax=Dendrosporobacter sp. 1207_IL3150 TaxID=3084054 RepID=UPI002FD91B97
MNSLNKKISLATIIMMLAIIFLIGCGNVSQSTELEKPRPNQLMIKVIDIGQGDAALLRTAEQTILIDTGDISERDKLVSFLKKQDIKVIDKVIITHPHADHLGGMDAVLDNFDVKQVYDSGITTTTKVYRQYLTDIKKKNIPFKVVTGGENIDFGGGVTFNVLAPEKPFIEESELNNNSIVGKVAFGKVSMLFTGDIEKEAEAKLIKNYSPKLKATILKSPHHGSETSSSMAFLRAVSPEVITISLGANNDYHHPHAKVLKRYKELKSQILQTDLAGTITIVTDGQSYNITKEK